MKKALKWIGIVLAGLVGLVPAAALFGAGLYPFAAIPLAIGAALAIGDWIAWRNTLHTLDARQILSRRGWLAPRLDIAPRIKLQSVDFRQGPLGRWHGYGTLHLGLAGGTFEIPGVPVERAREVRKAVLASIAEADFSELNRG